MTTDELIDIFTSLKRIFYDKPVPKPKKDSRDWDNLNRLATILNEKGISGEEYLLVNVRVYRKKNIFPRTSQLLGLKAMNRYAQYVRGRYRRGELFRTDPHSVVILSTNVYYPIDEFIKPFGKDLKVLLIWTYVKEQKTEFEKAKTEKLWDAYCYTLAKYEWFKQIPPNSLLEWGEKINERKTQA